MKLSGRAASGFCDRPDLALAGALIHGADAGQVTEARRRLVAAVLGNGVDDLRLTVVDAAAARKEAAAVGDALRARGFFPGRQVVLVEGGSDGLAKPLAAALESVGEEDAFLVVTADALPARSTLRRLFEGDGRLAALQLFADAPDASDIDAALRRAGAPGATPEAAAALAALGASMDHGSFARLIEILALHGLDRTELITADDVAALAPAGLDAEIDALVAAVADGAADAIGPLLRRLRAGGAAPVTVLIALQRHFRNLLAAVALGGGDAALGQLRPPVYGPRRSAMAAQVRRWGPERLAQANRLLLEADAKVRSTAATPEGAMLERCALRLALMAGR